MGATESVPPTDGNVQHPAVLPNAYILSTLAMTAAAGGLAAAWARLAHLRGHAADG